MKLKMQAATELLKNGNSVTETAEKLGFSSQAYFSLSYKRETAENPSASHGRNGWPPRDTSDYMAILL